jgi:hypothetical protein
MEKKRKFYVYLHRRLSDNLPFYLGKGSGKRAFSKSHRSTYWKRIVDKHGYCIEILQEFDDEQEAFEYEKDGIAALKEAGYPICNLTDGGEGVSGYKHTPEAIKLISEASKGRFLGFKHSQETIANFRSRFLTSGKFIGKLLYVYTATFIESGASITLVGNTALRKEGFNPSHVSKCCLGTRPSHKGYTFTRELIKKELL